MELENVEAEQTVLGSLLINNELLEKTPRLDKRHFFDPVHAEIFDCIKRKITEGRLASPVTLKLIFEDHPGLAELGGVQYLARICGVGINVGFSDLAGHLIDIWSLRHAKAALESGVTRIMEKREDEAVDKVLAGVESELSDAVEVTTDKPLTKSFMASMVEAIGSINSAYMSETIAGVSTGLDALDNKTGGFGKGELIVLAGRPSMGKSAVALNMATKAAMRGEGVFFPSLEMNGDQMAMRFFSQRLAEAGRAVPYFEMRQGNVSEDDFKQILMLGKEFENLPLIFAEREARQLSRLRAAARRAEKQLAARGTPLGLIVVDYLQLLNPDGAHKSAHMVEKVSLISGALKAMAMDFNCPVLALSQLNRAVELRDPPIPVLSDLRDSGSIEQDADIVIFCYRAEYYTERKIQAARGQGSGGDADLESLLYHQRNRLDLIVPKQRNGPTCTVQAHFDVRLNYLTDINTAKAFTDQGEFV